MVRLLTAVQKVEVVGGESWLSHNLGPILLAIAAISAAALAAYVATRNHRQQLEHDRQLRNQDHIRDTVDGAIVGVMDGINAVAALSGVVQGAERWHEDHTESPEFEEQKWEQERATAADLAAGALTTMLLTTARLEMRLGASHPITGSHEAVRRALANSYSNTPSSIGRSREESNRHQHSAHIHSAIRAVFHERFDDFRDACYEWFNE